MTARESKPLSFRKQESEWWPGSPWGRIRGEEIQHLVKSFLSMHQSMSWSLLSHNSGVLVFWNDYNEFAWRRIGKGGVDNYKKSWNAQKLRIWHKGIRNGMLFPKVPEKFVIQPSSSIWSFLDLWPRNSNFPEFFLGIMYAFSKRLLSMGESLIMTSVTVLSSNKEMCWDSWG